MPNERARLPQPNEASIVTDSPPDVQRIVAVLDRHRVDYLVVGGMAAALQGAIRPTLDFDCLA